MIGKEKNGLACDWHDSFCSPRERKEWRRTNVLKTAEKKEKRKNNENKGKQEREEIDRRGDESKVFVVCRVSPVFFFVFLYSSLDTLTGSPGFGLMNRTYDCVSLPS